MTVAKRWGPIRAAAEMRRIRAGHATIAPPSESTQARGCGFSMNTTSPGSVRAARGYLSSASNGSSVSAPTSSTGSTRTEPSGAPSAGSIRRPRWMISCL
ncbi:type VI secretion system Vgr family protein [Mycobacterium sp. SMC-8]|uniref:type VI secretion system Vgr family protein n=1 Tax=Mycobacterium sp. SMC-8 TaxID=2857060 RepID=UPI00220CA9E2|nr:type VI secretion system Vgr family protein [Mycobacterium sp. SMC-8]